MTSEVNDGAIPTEKVDVLRPRLSFETITFTDGTVLSLEDDDIVVFVGPNNAGTRSKMTLKGHSPLGSVDVLR